MAYVKLHNKGGVVYVSLPSKGGVFSSVFVSLSEGGVASIPIYGSLGGVAQVPLKKVCPLSLYLKEVCPLCASTSQKKVWLLCQL